MKRFALAICALLLSVTASAAQYIPGLNQPLSLARTAGGVAPPAFTVKNSGSFVAASSQEMHRAYGLTATHIWTVSFWLNLSSIAQEVMVGIAGSPTDGALGFKIDNATNSVQFKDTTGGATFNLIQTTTIGTSAWHHVCIAVDTTQVTAANRVHIYLDGTEGGYSTANYPALSAIVSFASATDYIGRRASGALFLDGLVSEYYYIDGSQLTPSSFVSGTGGSTKAIKYTGAFGANDIYLNFSNSGNLGADSSGNANNYTNNGVTQSATVPPF